METDITDEEYRDKHLKSHSVSRTEHRFNQRYNASVVTGHYQFEGKFVHHIQDVEDIREDKKTIRTRANMESKKVVRYKEKNRPMNTNYKQNFKRR